MEVLNLENNKPQTESQQQSYQNTKFIELIKQIQTQQIYLSKFIDEYNPLSSSSQESEEENNFNTSSSQGIF